MLDSGSDTHVYNSRHAFTTYRDLVPQESHIIMVGNTSIKAIGIGLVNLIVMGSNGPFMITLMEILYVLGNHINLVSVSRMRRGGVRLNEEIEWLICDGKPYIKPMLKGNFW